MSNTYNNFNYNPWETEEQRRQRLNGGMTPYNPNQTQTPYQAPEQQQLTPRQMVEQAWDRSAAEQEAKEKELEPMKNMSTREAIEYAWNKQEEKQNETKKKTNMFDTILKKGEQLASAGLNGLSLGFIDEIDGLIGGLGYGAASLNPAWNKTGESFAEAARRGYYQTRNNRRNILAEGKKEMPIAMGIAETIGSMSSNPYSKFLGASANAPIKLRALGNFKTNLANGITSAIGETEQNTVNEYAKNIGINTLSSLYANNATNRAMGRGGDEFTRRVLNEVHTNIPKMAIKTFSPDNLDEKDNQQYKLFGRYF